MSEKRDAFVQKLKAKIDEWNAEINRLNAKADQAEANMRAEYHDEIGKLKRFRDDAKQKLQKILESKEDVWEELKKGADKAYNAMNEALSSARERIK
jgi:predicted RNase H-like nuclease (RuvC/YqgF family)